MSTEEKSLKIINGQVVTPDGVIKNATVTVKSGIIESVTEGDVDLPGAVEIDAEGNYVGPGLIDIQINGYNSVSFSLEGAEDSASASAGLSVEDVKKVTEGLWKEGVTTYLPTLTTNSQELLIKNFRIIAKTMEDALLAQSMPGFHLEGPYISPVDGYRGAHPLEHVRKPDWDEFMEIYESSDKKIKIITVAPEIEGMFEFIGKCKDLGLVVSLGHHNGSPEQIKSAIDSGASLATHIGNGCAANINRHINPIWPQLADDRLKISFIADGFHLPPEVLKVFYKTKGVDNIVITSDITSYAGLPAGTYPIKGGKSVLKTEEGNLRFLGPGGGLYGSASPLPNGVAHIMNVTGCSLADAIKMTTLNAANLLNLSDRGILEPGRRADIILFSMDKGKMVIRKTILGGNEVFSGN